MGRMLKEEADIVEQIAEKCGFESEPIDPYGLLDENEAMLRLTIPIGKKERRIWNWKCLGKLLREF